jgi:hypothetical protein
MSVILTAQEAEIQRITVQGQPGQKSSQPIKSWVWWHTAVIPATWAF